MNALAIETLAPVRPDGPEDDAWFTFVTAQQHPPFEQLLPWGEVERHKGWSPGLLRFRLENRFVGGAHVLTQGSRFRVGSIRSGPLLAPSMREPAALACLAGALKRWAREQKLHYLFVQPCLGYADLEFAFHEAGFSFHCEDLPPQGLGKASAILDLGPEIDAIFARFKRSTRNYVYQSAKRGVAVRPGKRDDIPRFFELIKALCGRRGARPNVSSAEYIQRLWDTFHPREAVRLDIASYQGADIAAMMSLCYGNTVYLWRIGWNGAAADARPTEALYWHVIQAEKERGRTRCDINQIDPAEVERLRSGGAATGKTVGGVTMFKLGFGPDVVVAPRNLDYFPNPILRMAVKCGVPGWARRTGRRLQRLRGRKARPAPTGEP